MHMKQGTPEMIFVLNKVISYGVSVLKYAVTSNLKHEYSKVSYTAQNLTLQTVEEDIHIALQKFLLQEK